MRLCFIADPNAPHTRRWLEYFAGRGHEVHLITDYRPTTSFADISVHDLTSVFNVRKVRYPLWGMLVRRLVRRLQPHVLHAHQVSSAGWLGWAAGYHPFVVTPWGSDIYQHPQRSRAARWLARRVLSTADLVTADSADLLAQAIRLGADPARGCVIQWGVDLTVFSPADDRNAFRRSLGFQDRSIVLSPRAMRPIYNHDVTLRAVAAVRQAIPDVLFVFRNYHPAPLDYTDRLKRQAEIANLSDTIRFIDPATQYADMADLYRAADLVVSVPVSDGTPVSVLEALACGTPVVASDLPSLREWITDGQSGILVPVGDADALAQAIIRMLADSRLYCQIREKGLEIVRSRADHAAWMAQMETLYLKLAR
jgi:glycosyltransferase involved in cell wall biosynthesis